MMMSWLLLLTLLLLAVPLTLGLLIEGILRGDMIDRHEHGLDSTHRRPITEIQRRYLESKLRLRKYLLQNYSNDLLPMRSHKMTMIVDAEFVLRAVSQMSLKTQVLKINGWLEFQWHDELLQWDPELFDGISEVTFSKSQIWVPSLQLDNPKKQLMIGNDQMPLSVDHTGFVRFEPGVIIETMCPVDVTLYPFDTQVCNVVLISWTYSTQALLLRPVSSIVRLDHLTPNGEWRVIYSNVTSLSIKSAYRPGERYTAVMFTLKMERKSFFYVLNTMIPVILLSSVNMLVFLLPADCGERMSVAVSSLLSFTVYLEIISGDIPRTSEYTSILTVYLTLLLGLGTGSVLSAGFVLNIHYRNIDTMVPYWLRWGYTRFFMVDSDEDIKKRKCMHKLSGLEEKVEQALLRERAEQNEACKKNSGVNVPSNSEGTGLSKNPSEQAQNDAQETDRLGQAEGSRTNKSGTVLSDALATQFARELRKQMEERRKKRVSNDITWHDIGNALDWVMFWVFLISTNTVTAIILFMLLCDR